MLAAVLSKNSAIYRAKDPEHSFIPIAFSHNAMRPSLRGYS